MAHQKPVAANLPGDLRDETNATGKGDTPVAGLRAMQRRRAYRKAMSLRGEVRLELDVGRSRDRRR